MSSSQIKKNNINQLSLIFKEKILLNPYKLENLKQYATEGELNKELLRPIAWKLFLGVLPNTTSLREWVEIISNQREEFKKKIKKFCKIKKFIGDPLGGGSKKKKAADTSYEDNDLKSLINKDLDRTHQEIDLFLQNKIKNILANVLYIWSKENQDISYRQGMNELLAILYLVFYPYYFPSTKKPKNTKNDIIEFLKDIELYKEDIYIFFHDEEEIQSDLFYIFDALMKKGMSNLFSPQILQKDDPGYKMYEIFPQMWKDDSDEDKPTYVFRRTALLIKEKLKCLDNDLYSHFKKIDLNCGVFLQRWLRCIFCREFSLEDVYTIWDIILENDYTNENTEKYSFIFMEYICIAMIFKIRDTLKDADQNECFTTLFKYPETKDIMEIIKLSKKVEQAMNERLNGKNSNVYDILGIMKPIESEPTHIFSPHLFNQSGSKTGQNNNKSDTNSGNSSKNNFNTISENTYNKDISSGNTNKYNSKSEKTNNDINDNSNAYEQFDEDEKENINLDSVNHNYSNNNNDLGSQAKSFFNSAINSLTNFGGILKDQIQNATDTVIDSFTGNDTDNINNNNNNYNEYDDNYQQNDNYYNNNSNSNYNNNSSSNYNNRNSYNNESNDSSNIRKSSTEQSEENKNQNSYDRKASVDSNNDLAYNRQDMVDIVNKLKEMDTRYNMFFNDEDKKNFRIIIDYLKAKI